YYHDQTQRFQAALQAAIIKKISLTDTRELMHFAYFAQKRTLGAGECSAIAAAVHRKHCLAIDDGRAIKQARDFAPDLRILQTQDLMVNVIQEGFISLAEADAILHAWTNLHRYRLRISSFRELLPHLVGIKDAL